jgi:MinD-like ATPase involved in chromosome partitioning or flagellar assembly
MDTPHDPGPSAADEGTEERIASNSELSTVEASHNGHDSGDVVKAPLKSESPPAGVEHHRPAPERPLSPWREPEPRAEARVPLERVAVMAGRLRYAFDWIVHPGLRKRHRAALDELWNTRTTKKIYAFLNSKGSSGKTAGSTTAGVLYADAIKRDCVAVDMNDSPGGTAKRLGIKREETLTLREYLRRYRAGDYVTAETITRQLEWTRESGLFVIASEAVSNTYDHNARPFVRRSLEQLAETVHSVFCDLGNGIKSDGNWSAVEAAHTLVFMGNVNAADSVVDFKRHDPTGEGDDLQNTMDAYSAMKMPHKVKQGIIVILGAKTKMRQRYADHYGFPVERVFVVPNNGYMKRGSVVRKDRLPLRIRVIFYEILVAMVKAERPPAGEIKSGKTEQAADADTPTQRGDTEPLPRVDDRSGADAETEAEAHAPA